MPWAAAGTEPAVLGGGERGEGETQVGKQRLQQQGDRGWGTQGRGGSRHGSRGQTVGVDRCEGSGVRGQKSRGQASHLPHQLSAWIL